MSSPPAGNDTDAPAARCGSVATSAPRAEGGEWTLVITPRRSLLSLPIRDLWEFRDLLGMLVQRDIVTIYKQTILGPIWYVFQPLMTMLMFVLIFGNIANIPTDGVPQPLFYLAGIVLWNYFAETFSRTSGTFLLNAELFGKVYFPRLLVPLSFVISGLIKFAIQLGLLLVLYAWFLFTSPLIHPNAWLLLIPVLMLLMAGLGLGFGILFSSLTTKYRDLNFVIQFGVQLLMYATPIIYPMSLLSPRMRSLMWWNPLAHLVEIFRYGLLGAGAPSWSGLGYASLFTVLLVLVSVLIFNRTEQNFMDTV